MKMKTLLALIGLLLFAKNTQAQRIKAGEVLPENILQTRLISENNDTTTLAAVFATIQMKVVFVDFWASWCGPCMKEMPHSKKLQRKLDDKSIVFAYFSTDEKQENWVKKKNDLKLSGINYRIAKEDKKAIQKLFNIPGIPYYCLISKDMKVLVPKAKWPAAQKNLLKQLDPFLENM